MIPLNLFIEPCGSKRVRDEACDSRINATLLWSEHSDIPGKWEEEYLLKLAFTKKADSRWLNEFTCNITGQLWPKMDAKKSKPLIPLDQFSITITA